MSEEQLPVSRFAIRLSSRVPEEVMLSRLMAEDLAERRINLSSVVKSLLLAWYQQRMATGELTTPLSSAMSLSSPLAAAMPAEEVFEDPADELVLRMAGISFDEI
jgi:hypothetical protein